MRLLLSAIRLALGAIVRNKTRAALTVLGILIGVAAVVGVTGLATGASEQVGGEINSFAAEAIYINPQTTAHTGARGKVSGRLTENDAKAVARDAVSVVKAGVFSKTAGQVIYGDKNVQTSLMGVNLGYFYVR